jgi:hypothetical protein
LVGERRHERFDAADVGLKTLGGYGDHDVTELALMLCVPVGGRAASPTARVDRGRAFIYRFYEKGERRARADTLARAAIRGRPGA